MANNKEMNIRNDNELKVSNATVLQSYAYVPALAPLQTGEQKYHGFGLNSWQSGPQVTITRIHAYKTASWVLQF